MKNQSVKNYATLFLFRCEFWDLKKLLNLPHENLVHILCGHVIGINIRGCQPNLEIPIYVISAFCP